MAKDNKAKDKKAKDTKAKNKKEKTESIHTGHRQRMHAKFDATGFKGWSKFEILEYMLYYVFRQGDTNPTAHALFNYSAQSIVKLFENTQDFRMVGHVKGVKEPAIRFLRSLKEFMLYYQRESLKEHPVQFTRDNFYEVLKMLDLSDENEEIAVICMDKLLQIKAVVKLTDQSDTTYASFEIDQLIKAATQAKAANVVLIHTHPSGVDRASYEDIMMTKEVQRILETIRISLVDHFIVCGDKLISIMQTIYKMEVRNAGTDRRYD